MGERVEVGSWGGLEVPGGGGCRGRGGGWREGKWFEELRGRFEGDGGGGGGWVCFLAAVWGDWQLARRTGSSKVSSLSGLAGAAVGSWKAACGLTSAVRA